MNGNKSVLGMIVGLMLISQSTGVHGGALLNAVSVTGAGSYNNSESLLTDGTIPPEFTSWTDSRNVYWQTSDASSVSFTFDYGAQFQIEDILFSFDNNDAYRIDYSTNNTTWTRLTEVLTFEGDVWNGMDTGTSIDSHGEYIAGMDFTPVSARYLKVYATTGDERYALGEFQAYGTGLSAVPEPGTAAPFLAIGLIGLLHRRRVKRPTA